mgnify:FL=1|tara:strand:- start:438 stop:1409 length:972 start_codon:yes stop_codon:yes gene_type:complete
MNQTVNKPDSLSAMLEAKAWLRERVIGQEKLIDRLIISLITGGHLLVEGAPGLAKTRAIKELSTLIQGDFHRIQFTPDLLPSDVTGTEVYRPEDGTFVFQKGPIFHNLVLADEINRAPAKVQSALLEAMGENQVSFGRKTFELPKLFFVMATQNPIEQEGTYPLPEAQLDRFIMQVLVDYPDHQNESDILKLVREENISSPSSAPLTISQDQLLNARKELLSLHMEESIEKYIVGLIMATREPSGPASEWIEYGSSPRGTISLDQCARSIAWLSDRDFVTPDDVQNIIHDVMRHRLILTFEAESQGITVSQVIDEIVRTVPVP